MYDEASEGAALRSIGSKGSGVGPSGYQSVASSRQGGLQQTDATRGVTEREGKKEDIPTLKADLAKKTKQIARLTARVKEEEEIKEREEAEVRRLIGECEKATAGATAGVINAVNEEAEANAVVVQKLRDEIRGLKIENKRIKDEAKQNHMRWGLHYSTTREHLFLATHLIKWLLRRHPTTTTTTKNSVRFEPSSSLLSEALFDSTPAPALTDPSHKAGRPLISLPDSIDSSVFAGKPLRVPASALYEGISEAQKAAVREVVGATNVGVCAGKGDGADAPLCLSVDLRAMAANIVDLHRSKPGTVLDELSANFASPHTPSTPGILIAAAKMLKEAKRHSYPGYSKYDLLVMHLYTMSGSDIDALMGFDVPKHGTPEYEMYNEVQRRNAAMFREVNGALRAASFEKGGTSGPGWGAVQKWVKTICFLHQLTARGTIFDTEKGYLARGLAGLPSSSTLAHSELSSGDVITWVAPSSCSLDAQIAESYIMGEAANSTRSAGGAVLFKVRGQIPSVLLAAVSKYPDEEEILVPPLSYLKVSGVVQDTPNVPHVGLLWTGVEELLIGDHPEGPVYSPRRGGGGGSVRSGAGGGMRTVRGLSPPRTRMKMPLPYTPTQRDRTLSAFLHVNATPVKTPAR